MQIHISFLFYSFLFFLFTNYYYYLMITTATDRWPPGKAAVAHKTIARDRYHVTAPRYQDRIA